MNELIGLTILLIGGVVGVWLLKLALYVWKHRHETDEQWRKRINHD